MVDAQAAHPHIRGTPAIAAKAAAAKGIAKGTSGKGGLSA